MSRIGKKPIPLPAGVTVTQDGNVVKVKGAKGELSEKIHKNMEIIIDGGEVRVNRPNDEKENRALHGLSRSLIANMVQGVSEGFEKKLEVVGVGYRAALQGKKLVLNVGYSHPVEMDAPGGIEFDVPSPNSIIVKGISKQVVGETAAKIRETRKPEPYKGKGIRYENEYVRRKAGKTGA